MNKKISGKTGNFNIALFHNSYYNGVWNTFEIPATEKPAKPGQDSGQSAIHSKGVGKKVVT